jgi:hypothetical protein
MRRRTDFSIVEGFSVLLAMQIAAAFARKKQLVWLLYTATGVLCAIIFIFCD